MCTGHRGGSGDNVEPVPDTLPPPISTSHSSLFLMREATCFPSYNTPRQHQPPALWGGAICLTFPNWGTSNGEYSPDCFLPIFHFCPSNLFEDFKVTSGHQSSSTLYICCFLAPVSQSKPGGACTLLNQVSIQQEASLLGQSVERLH